MTSANWAVGSISNPVGAYRTPSNWNGGVVPDEVATFGQSYMSIVSITASTNVGGWTIGSQPYTFIVANILTFTGQGIVGGAGSAVANSGYITFIGSASAGFLIYNNSNWMGFGGTSSAGNAVISNTGDLLFAQSSTAGNALISVAKTGNAEFAEGATAGAATLVTAAEGSQIGRVVFSGDGPAHDHKLTAGSFSGNGIFDLGLNEVTVGNGLDTTVSGQIIGSSTGRLVKVGYGTMTLSGINTYGGGTVVNDGTLVVNGAVGKVSVGDTNHSGQLSGNGIVGATTVNNGSLSAGPGYYEAGRLSTGTLDLQRKSWLVVDIVGISSPGAQNGYDQISVTGKVKLAGELNAFYLGSPDELLPRHTITIIDNDGKDKVSGAFSNGTLYGGLNEGDAFDAGYMVYSISYKGGTGNDVVLRSEGHVTLGTVAADTINLETAAGAGNYKATKYADIIYAQEGDDTVDAAGGNDTVAGGPGKDWLNGGKGKDLVSYLETDLPIAVTLNGSKLVTVRVGGQAEDKIKNFENVGGTWHNDKLTGDSKDNILLGDRGNDTLKGGGGNDVLVGGRDKDVLEGGGGKDQFVFNTKIGTDSVDTVKDFHHGEDKLLLGALQFAAIGSKLDANEFYAKAGATKAHDASDRIIYNTSNGRMYYDDDGKGGHAAVLVAKLAGHPSLSVADFTVIPSFAEMF
ncbi:MAG: autotransporter-associated beta strand repeat-containing protein [Devosia sp.]